MVISNCRWSENSAVKVKNVAAVSRNCYKRLNHVRLLNTIKGKEVTQAIPREGKLSRDEAG